jgi:leader peptidase (prepilin peptidase)/N-methyltransferase
VILLAFLFGLLVGSFLNVCIHRWPLDESVVQPRSRCPHCGRPISAFDNVPLLSFVLLRGRCRHCAQAIPWRYPLVEILNACLFAGLIWRFGVDALTLKAALFGSMMLVLIFTDMEHYILPDEITKGGLVIGLIVSLFLPMPDGLVKLGWMIAAGGGEPDWRWLSLSESVLGAVLFGGGLWVLREGYYRMRGVDGLGLGDVKMAAMMGSFWGVGHTLLILLLGSLGGALVGLVIVFLGGKKWNYEMPFGSYLGAAALIVTIWGDTLFGLYWKAVGPAGG